MLNIAHQLGGSVWFAILVVFAMAVFATSAAVAFAWAVSAGQFRDLSDAAASIFWDEAADGR
jgi:cbb3-type cytochrome oxidase maturation protein